ncbi:MAG TPA: class I SAM-dependent methyltransferase, partial [Anaerolineales bacterium]|nr:class I SAM-dependent methyltransferase [Anaerolineales bacterium]
WIYRNNRWRDEESVSGPGSSLKYTENLRKELPNLLKDYSIQRIFDAPCGDFNWMRHLLTTVDVDYIGGDIVLPLVESLNLKYKQDNVSFIHIDLIKDGFPKSDIMICRDCLFHLSFEDTKSVLRNFLVSETPYLLTTTHKNIDGFKNSDIQIGGFRRIDLFSPPYNFPSNALASIDDWISPYPERQMCLWNREQVSLAFAKFN